jgi:hypothetical protein
MHEFLQINCKICGENQVAEGHPFFGRRRRRRSSLLTKWMSLKVENHFK